MTNLERAQEALSLYSAADNSSKEPPHAKILDLVSQGVDVQITDNSKYTLLHWAAYKGHRDVCELLIQQNAEIDAHNNGGHTPLHFAAMGGNTEVIKFLLEQSAELHARDGLGRNPLHWADSFNKTEATIFLLACGANIWSEMTGSLTVVNKDKTKLIKPHRDEWVPKLQAVMDGKFDAINTTQDLYHLASVMKPANPKKVPPPKEFIHILFQQYLPHDDKFNAMYEEIFVEPRAKPLDLQSARAAAQGRGVVL